MRSAVTKQEQERSNTGKRTGIIKGTRTLHTFECHCALRLTQASANHAPHCHYRVLLSRS
jgi:hypothetical protein